MNELGLTLFETAIGTCGIVWSGPGVVGVQLPARTEAATRASLQRRFQQARDAEPPPDIQRAIDAVTALLNGEARDLNAIAVDFRDTPEFNQRVYAVARSVGPGKTISYGEIAERLGDRLLARDVAQALSQNPCPIIVPCHRVTAAGRKTGGFSAPGGVQTKLKLLSIEGARLEDEPMLFERLPLVKRV